ncbi:MAG: CPBP family intramembrane metalloprotease [Verrucomicrobia bacterium]|nr:CPBP family intramembrane metalloprotease [Verrucomicrobiota bacterium]MCH8513211.1 CPBP family intramembrane metalloprotease [Kiritimatiellia bacterium]
MNVPENPESEEQLSAAKDPAEMTPWTPPPAGRLHRLPVMRRQPVGECSYCGAPLSGHLFFCQVCGKPYREPPGNKMMPVPRSDGERIHEDAPSFWPVFWTFACALFASVMLSLIFFGSEREFRLYHLVFQTIALLAVTVILSAKHFDLLWGQLKRPGFNHAEAWMGMLALVPLIALNWFWHYPLLEALLSGKPDFMRLDRIGLEGPGLWLLFCIFPAIIEEIAFRGLLQPMLMNALPKGKAMLIVAAIFAGMHFSIYSFPYLLLVGLYFGWLQEKTKSLYPCIVAHALHNAFVIAFFW